MFDAPRDDRDQLVEDDDAIEWHGVEPAWQEMSRDGRRKILLIGVLSVACVIAACFLWWYTGRNAAILVGLIPMGLVPLFWSSISTGIRQRSGIRALLSHARCEQCTYDLSDLPPEPDGCIVCPECGAAWRLPADANNPA